MIKYKTMKEDEKFTDGWEGFTKRDLHDMYNTNTAQYPIWVRASNGNGFDAEATLRANGLHPDKIPEALRDHYIAGELIKEIANNYPLQYTPTPDKNN